MHQLSIEYYLRIKALLDHCQLLIIDFGKNLSRIRIMKIGMRETIIPGYSLCLIFKLIFLV